MSLDSWIDWVAIIAAILLIVVGVLSFFGIINAIVVYATGVVLIIGGLAGIVDGFIEWSDNAFLGIVYVLLFLITIALGFLLNYSALHQMETVLCMQAVQALQLELAELFQQFFQAAKILGPLVLL